MIGIDWYEKSKTDKKVFQYIEQLKNIDMNKVDLQDIIKVEASFNNE